MNPIIRSQRIARAGGETRSTITSIADTLWASPAPAGKRGSAGHGVRLFGRIARAGGETRLDAAPDAQGTKA